MRGTYEDGPHVDDEEEGEVEYPVQREKENEKVVRQALRIPIKRVECMRSERRRY